MKAVDFINRHKLNADDFDIGELADTFINDMTLGLEGAEGGLSMIPTYIDAENRFLKETPVLAIDAGGTNFRAALIKFTSDDEIEFINSVNYTMPGLDREISAAEFFETVADYVRPLAEKTDRIGFCFSYPTEILPDRDGRLIKFCKEVRAPEVHGQLIGKGLLESLKSPSKKIVLLNDTVATLLAGKSVAMSRQFDSYIGFILGTGTNTCYIEKNAGIIKKKDIGQSGTMIINVESGNFLKGPRTDLDLEFDRCTTDPGSYTFEKMFSGGYFGGLYLSVLKAAANEGVFTDDAAKKLKMLTVLATSEANEFAGKGKNAGNILNICFSGNEDLENASRILNALIERAAKLVAANLAAVVLKSGKGKSKDLPVLITIEGTTFYTLHGLQQRFEEYFSSFLDGDKKRFTEFTGVPKSGLIGAALAGLIE
jgi:hexokinase